MNLTLHFEKLDDTIIRNTKPPVTAKLRNQLHALKDQVEALIEQNEAECRAHSALKVEHAALEQEHAKLKKSQSVRPPKRTVHRIFNNPCGPVVTH
ncbi:MAG: hypothetical protein ABSD29_14550 [Verrucomicrobiota bacterium]|jgi:arsenate reductase-like glutaredoxin family protein